MIHKKLRIYYRVFLALLAALAAWVGTGGRPAPVMAATHTYTVNSTADLPDTDQGDGICLASNNACTLRAAIMQANYIAGADIIKLPAGTFTLTRPGNDDVAVLGDLDITDSLTIQGAGSALTIVDGNSTVTGDRVFQVTASAKETTFSGLTMRNGKKTSSAFDEGGGFYWDGGGGHLTLSDVTIENNTASYGGGLFLNYSAMSDSVVLNKVIIRSNSATSAAGGLGVNFGDFASFDMQNGQVYSNQAYEGGGVYFQSSLSFDLASVRIENNSNIYLNTASLSAGFENHSGDATVPVVVVNSGILKNHANYYGGGIGNYGTLDILTSTVDGNSAAMLGGGIYNYEGGKLDIQRSTLSRNTAQTGGGIYSELFIHGAAITTLTNSTLSGNIASQDGGGIYLVGGQVKLYNATIANNQILVPTGTVYAGMGGGVYVAATGFFTAENALIAENTHRYQTAAPVKDDFYGTLDSLGYNLIETTSNSTITGTTSGDLTGFAPHLSPLQFNGGPTQTQSPLPGSPAVDSGQMPSCTDANGAAIVVDQRGIQRPLGPRCDIGAVESFPYGLSLFLPALRQ